MPACGKSYWGQRLADKHNRPFADLDTYIGTQVGKTIPQLFTLYGEEGFRMLEHNYLTQLLSETEENTIIACGGGTPCFHNNIQLLKDAGRVVYLEATPELLYKHILKSDEERPLLNSNIPLIKQLDNLLRQRKLFYEQAHYILQAQDITLATFDKILNDV